MARVISIRKEVQRVKVMLHGWSIESSVRAATKTVDLCLIDPRDGQKLHSIVALQRKLVLPRATSATDGESAASAAQRSGDGARVASPSEADARRSVVAPSVFMSPACKALCSICWVLVLKKRKKSLASCLTR